MQEQQWRGGLEYAGPTPTSKRLTMYFTDGSELMSGLVHVSDVVRNEQLKSICSPSVSPATHLQRTNGER